MAAAMAAFWGGGGPMGDLSGETPPGPTPPGNMGETTSGRC